MTEVLLYNCPSCTASCSVAPDLVGLNVVCPNCTQEFTATPQDSADVPFFKSGNLEILKNRLNELMSDGALNISDEIALTRATSGRCRFLALPAPKNTDRHINEVAQRPRSQSRPAGKSTLVIYLWIWEN
jgi:hypothetical protein